MANDASIIKADLAYDAIINRLQSKLKRQELVVLETKQHIQAIEAMKYQQSLTKTDTKNK